MKTFHVMIPTVQDAKEFVNSVSKAIGFVDVGHNSYCVDGKSILGVLSLDLSKELDVQCFEDEAEHVHELISKWEV